MKPRKGRKIFANIRSLKICCIMLAPRQSKNDLHTETSFCIGVNTSTSIPACVFHFQHSPPQHRSAAPGLHLTVTPVALGVLELPGVAAASLGVVVAVALVDTTGLLAGGGETTGLAVLGNGSVPDSKTGAMAEPTLWTGLQIQLMRASRRMALCWGSTRMTSKYL